MSLIETRFDQMFPVLDAVQFATARRFASAPARKFAPGEALYDVGQHDGIFARRGAMCVHPSP